MFKVKKKNTRVTSTNCVFMPIEVIVSGVSFFKFWIYFTLLSTVFTVTFEQVNTIWESDSFAIN